MPRAWVRARRTILSADAVSFLAAAILYVLAIGDVKGFAFTLGMSTVLDLVVVFLFTHPLMAVLARFKSFGSSRLSGLGRVEHTRRPAAPAAPAAVNSSVPAAGSRHGQEHLMTRPRRRHPTADGTSRWAPTPTSSRTPTRCWPRRPRLRRRGGARRRRAAPRRVGTAASARVARRRVSLAHRLYNGEAGLDVVGHSRLIYKVTAVVVLICLLSMVFRGFNFGIDFEGGNSFRVPGTSEQLTEVRTAAEDAGAEVATAQVVGGNTVLLRTGAARHRRGERRRATPSRRRPGSTPQQVSPDAVSADWGNDITDQALIALVVFLVAVVAFLALRFQPKMAIGAMAVAAARHHRDGRRLLADRLRGHARRRSSAS